MCRLDRRQAGDFLRVSAPYPPFKQLAVRNGGGRFVGILCFGVGITEALPVAEAELRRGDVVRVCVCARECATTAASDVIIR